MTSEWMAGLVSGLLCAAFGMALYAIWDAYKEKKSTARRNHALEEVVATDLAINLARAQHNIDALAQELPTLADRRSIVEPLPLLRTGFWEILRLEPSSALLTVEDKAKLHNIYDLTERTNERLRAREEFKNNNGAMSSFPSTMRIHDEELIKALNDLLAAIRALDGKPKEGPTEQSVA